MNAGMLSQRQLLPPTTSDLFLGNFKGAHATAISPSHLHECRGSSLHIPASLATSSGNSSIQRQRIRAFYTVKQRRVFPVVVCMAPGTLAESSHVGAHSVSVSSSGSQADSEHQTETSEQNSRRSRKGRTVKQHKRLALHLPQPQPRIWAAASRSAPPLGAMSSDPPIPPGLELLQSLHDFKQPQRVRTSPPPPTPRLQSSVSVKDVLKTVQRFRLHEGGSAAPVVRGGAIVAGNTGGAGLVGGKVGGEAAAACAAHQSAAPPVLGADGEAEGAGQHARLRGSRKWKKGREPMDLEQVVAEAQVVVLNAALTVLGSAHLLPNLDALLQQMLGLGRHNPHTWASAFRAYAEAGRPDRAIQLFQTVCRQGIDIGPAGASALMKLCMDQDNLDMGLELFYKMTSLRTTFNRYVYNCLLHLCGMHGRVYDSLDLLAAMRTDGSILEDCKPDGYTYSALLRAITASKKWELLPLVYKQMMRDKVDPDMEVWAQLVALAGRANRVELAAAYFNAALASKAPPITPLYNAMLAAMARGGKDLEQIWGVYEDMRALALPADAYTFVPLFSALAKAGSSLQDVDALAVEMKTMGVKLNTQLGTALLNAYKHVPTMGSPATSQACVTRADDLLPQLVAQGHANMQTYMLAACVHAQAGSLASVQRVLREAVRAHAPPDARALHSLSLACEDGGLTGAAAHFMEQAVALQRAQAEAKQRREGRRGALGR